jgi:hypothetical protein
MVRYRVKPDRVQENERLVRAVYEQLHAGEPDGTQYATFRLEDGVSFVHLHSNTRDDGVNALSELPAFKEFTREIADRCDEAPVVTPLSSEIGSYRLFES